MGHRAWSVKLYTRIQNISYGKYSTWRVETGLIVHPCSYTDTHWHTLLRVDLRAVITTSRAKVARQDSLVIIVSRHVRGLAIVLTRLQHALMVQRRVARHGQRTSHLRVTTHVLLIGNRGHTVPVRVEVILRLVPVRRQTSQRTLHARFLNRHMLIRLRNMHLGALMRLNFVLIAHVNNVRAQINRPVLRSRHVTRVLRTLLKLLGRCVCMDIQIVLPTFHTMTPTGRRAALHVHYTQGNFTLLTPLVVQMTIVMKGLTRAIRGRLITRLSATRIRRHVLRQLMRVTALANVLTLRRHQGGNSRRVRSTIKVTRYNTKLHKRVTLTIVPTNNKDNATHKLHSQLRHLSVLRPTTLIRTLRQHRSRAQVSHVCIVPSRAGLFRISQTSVLCRRINFLRRFNRSFLTFQVSRIRHSKFLINVRLGRMRKMQTVRIIRFVAYQVSTLRLLRLSSINTRPYRRLHTQQTKLRLHPIGRNSTFRQHNILHYLYYHVIHYTILRYNILHHIIHIHLVRVVRYLILLVSNSV